MQKCKKKKSQSYVPLYIFPPPSQSYKSKKKGGGGGGKGDDHLRSKRKPALGRMKHNRLLHQKLLNPPTTIRLSPPRPLNPLDGLPRSIHKRHIVDVDLSVLELRGNGIYTTSTLASNQTQSRGGIRRRGRRLTSMFPTGTMHSSV